MTMNKKFNILVVEDDLMLAEMTEYMLSELNYALVGIAKNYETALQYLEEYKEIDMAILDINLEGEKTGIDIGKEINDKYKIPFIYLTSFTDPITIKKAAKTAPSAYLLKPYSKHDLFSTIEMVKERKLQTSQSIIIKDGDLNIKIQRKNINYIKSDNNYIEIYTSNKKYTQRSSIESFLEELSNPNFMRIHRSYAVNINKVDAVNGQYVLIGEDKCPLSRIHKDEVLKFFVE